MVHIIVLHIHVPVDNQDEFVADGVQFGILVFCYTLHLYMYPVYEYYCCSGVFTIGPLGPCPPLNYENFLHMAKMQH